LSSFIGQKDNSSLYGSNCKPLEGVAPDNLHSFNQPTALPTAMGKAQKDTRVGILDDHLGLMQSIAGIINDFPGMKVNLMATTIPALLHKLQSKTIDILLLDLSLRPPEQGQLRVDGDVVLPELAEKYPKIKVVVHSLHNDSKLMALMIEKGARGYLCKDCGLDELETALKAVDETGWYFNQELSMALKNRIKEQGEMLTTNDFLASLSENELECWRYILHGYTINATADEMNRSPSAVKGYRKNLREKAQCKSVAELICLGLKHGLNNEKLN